MANKGKAKTKQFFPFTDYSPQTERKLKRLFLLGERGTLKRVVQDGIIVGLIGAAEIFKRPSKERKITAISLSDDEIKKLMPKAEIIKRGRGGVTVIVNPSAPKLPTSRRTFRITPKTPKLRK